MTGKSVCAISQNRLAGLFLKGVFMKREEKSALSRQRILEAAMEEFSLKGYEGASLNAVWAEKGISKGIIYHHFRDKDELYLLCVKACFDHVTAYLQAASDTLTGSTRDRLQNYFDARLRFFAENPLYLGIFVDAAYDPPENLISPITQLRQDFDALNIAVLTDLLKNEPLRSDYTVDQVVEDFRIYMDYFNLHFKADVRKGTAREDILREHEKRCHRQLDILLYGISEVKNK